MSTAAPNVCQHTALCVDPSIYTTKTGYHRPSLRERLLAATSETSKSKRELISTSAEFIADHAYPAPLILPGDELACDPDYPKQSLRDWQLEGDRNPVTSKRNVVYVTAPLVDSKADYIQQWTQLEKIESGSSISEPKLQDVIDYISAYYNGLSVKALPIGTLCFTSWDESSTKGKGTNSKSGQSATGYIGLRTATELIRIRARPSRDGLFQCQLNLDDLLDVAISVLPRDAYALLIVVNHDLFEDDDDDFVCGRAYGGSRVAVVSTARYHPLLDVMQGVDREHAWPASHCQAYLKQMCVKGDTRRKKARKTEEEDNLTGSGTSLPLETALVAHKILPSLVESTTSGIPSSSASTSTGLWLSRICRTAAHELGHCFGIDHCVYYACAMQGSASICEDNRQPPYLCPVDLVKVIQATGAIIKDRNLALLSFCDRFPEVHLFAAFAAWIRAKESEPKKPSEGCSSHKTSQ